MPLNPGTIPADTTIEMTDDLIRAFKLLGCDPTCHNCGMKLTAGVPFKLAYVKDPLCWADCSLEYCLESANEEDEMLCDNCTADDLLESRKVQWKEWEKEYEDRRLHRGRFRGYTRHHVKSSEVNDEKSNRGN